MLSKDEKLRVLSCLDASKADLKKDVTYASEYYVSTVLWLAEKLKESDDNLAKVTEELEKSNEK